VGYSLVDILQAIGDVKSLEVLIALTKGPVRSDTLRQRVGITKKQFYFRTHKLLGTGIIQRKKGKFSLTSLGLVVYQAQVIIQAGLNGYWKLKAIDSIDASGQISDIEREKLVKTILNDNTVASILLKH